jgi:chromosomal replication initiator protein
MSHYSELLQPKRPHSTEITIAQIQRIASIQCGVSIAALISPQRTEEVALCRHVAMYLSYILTNNSYQYIGRMFGNRKHTTVLHGVNRITKLIEQDSEVAEIVDKLRRKIINSRPIAVCQDAA